MSLSERIVCFDEDLGIEAYWFKGLMHKFPNHFHEDYVIGFIESGTRQLSCKNKKYNVGAGDLLLFNPLENHTCCQLDVEPLDYRSINISPEVMRKVVLEITGKSYLPEFASSVAFKSEYLQLLRDFHDMLMEKREEMAKIEALYFLMEQFLREYTNSEPWQCAEISSDIQKVGDFLATKFMERISLDVLSEVAGLNKYTLLRKFTHQCGVTPYQYLETLRVNHAKKLLETGVEPAEAAISAGFTDQSHFTRFFKNFIGLTPKQYQNIFINLGKS